MLNATELYTFKWLVLCDLNSIIKNLICKSAQGFGVHFTEKGRRENLKTRPNASILRDEEESGKTSASASVPAPF